MRLVVKMSFVMLMLIVVLAACGGGSDDVSPSTTPSTPGTPTDPETPQAGSNAPYTVSVVNGSAGAATVSVGSEAIAVEGRTVQLESATQVGFQPGHHRAFDTPGATSGPALEVHLFGESEGYDHIQFGSWAKGIVSPTPGFRIGEEYGAFLAPHSAPGLTPTSNLPTTGTAIWEGSYAGYVDRLGVGVSQVVGKAAILASFGATLYGGDGAVTVELLPPDPSRSSFAAPPSAFASYTDRVFMGGLITGNTFENDVTDTYTISGHTIPNPFSISVTDVSGGCRTTVGGCLYSHGEANSGEIQGGFFAIEAAKPGGRTISQSAQRRPLAHSVAYSSKTPIVPITIGYPSRTRGQRS